MMSEVLEKKFLDCCLSGSIEEIAQIVFDENMWKFINVNCLESVDGNSGLILAVRQNHEDLVKFLLENTDIDVNIANKFGYTALMLAAYNGNVNILNQLLDHPDTDIEIVNKAGRKAENCGRKKNCEMVQNLISQTRKRKQPDTEFGDVAEPLSKVPKNCNSASSVSAFVNAFEEESKSLDCEASSSLISDDLKTVLSARLENCLIDLGSVDGNLMLCMLMKKMASKMNLSVLETICRKAVLEYLTTETVFEILKELHHDREVKDICVNFIISNIDSLKLKNNWKDNLKILPDVSVDIIERL